MRWPLDEDAAPWAITAEVVQAAGTQHHGTLTGIGYMTPHSVHFQASPAIQRHSAFDQVVNPGLRQASL